ncbi:RAVE protein 1 C terminal-domain-containing protein [Hygrophoropsis aurantiaca]|uniref:RAVE protein 1 C terminal-domain-containing protein n=1 Tax=Hygrophoropsis aurantiaca TaxID=72124 RepID=A0ACB8AH01_9AGAM|nr:RAVE protein 1 C terminal-domain-containing protein [Hygrophoropsis aurantiaca]
MLDLLQTFTGGPAGAFQHLVLPHVTLIVFSSADAVVLLDAATLSLVRILAFREVFPDTQHWKQSISSVAVDSAMRVIVASMNTRIAAWSMSGAANDTWRIHSSLILPDGDTITALDCRSGLLSIGSSRCLSVYTLILENDLLTWTKKWSSPVTTPSLVKLSPTLTYIATTSHADNNVRLYSTTSGKQTQGIKHPRLVIDVIWRYSQASRSDDPSLYTVTSDSTLRIFIPVIDSPQRLQLHASLDLFSLTSFSKSFLNSRGSQILWLNKETVARSIKSILDENSGEDTSSTKRMREILNEGWDLFLRVMDDGSMVISAVENIDHRPPTFLRRFNLSNSPPYFHQFPSYLCLLQSPDPKILVLATTSPLCIYELSVASFFEGQPGGLRIRARGLARVSEEEDKILRLVRTPAGRGVAVMRTNGGDVWRVVQEGSNLIRAGRSSSADQIVALNGGRLFATYRSVDSLLTLHSNPKSTLSIPQVTSLFSLPHKGGHECIMGLTPDFSIVHVHVSESSLALHSHHTLPLPRPPKLVLPVDPMAWSGTKSGEEHDTLLSVSEEGELAFWLTATEFTSGWRCTGTVKTGRRNFRIARCSSAKKSALIVRTQNGDELTIWDSKESEFASGLEYSRVFSPSEPVNDLDWTSTPDDQSILAVGFAHHVELLCQQRKTYFDDALGWDMCWTIEIGTFIPYPICDSIWLANGSLLIAAGHQLCLFGQKTLQDGGTSESLFGYAALHNGPLPDYHPQMLLQCLLWDKTDLVKEIILQLCKSYRNVIEGGQNEVHWQPIPLEHYLRHGLSTRSKFPQPRRYNFLFNSPQENTSPDDDGFSRSAVLTLIEQLEAHPFPHLTPNEHAQLLVLVQTTLEIDEQSRAIDSNGLRYVISMRSFYILNRRITSDPSSPRSIGTIPRETGWRERLRYRDMIWAFHSESQDLLLNISTSACRGKMVWADARALGVFLWLNSVETMKAHMEVIARNEYMAGENRDPTACSLFYFALGKVKLVHGLWRQAAWHKEQSIMLKFLNNDFTQARWKTAALKNAYALMGKQRFEYAAAFFLLGGSLKDAVIVCIKQLSDFQLALALARVVEQDTNGPILRDILNKTVLPIAFREGNRWLGSWAFWLLHRRDLSVKILLTPLQEIAKSLDIMVQDIGDPHYDDPSLALLFSQLKFRTLQAAKGTSEISARSEFNFVLQTARVFRRMGCHILALDLVRSWSFERPSLVVSQEPLGAVAQHSAHSPVPKRHSFAVTPAMRRRSSIMIDIDISNSPPTRKPSPESMSSKDVGQTVAKEKDDLVARKAGLGSLMKSAKRDVQVPEFDMSAFM